MFHNIGDKEYHCEYTPKAPDLKKDYLLAYRGGDILLKNGAVPRLCEADECEFQYLFSISGSSFFMNRSDICETDSLKYESVQILRRLMPQWLAFAGVTGHHLYKWYSTSKYCSACAAELFHKADERALVCPECGRIIYPTMAVAIIVAITNGDKLLVSRYSGRDYKNYALIAGFVEIGESLEDTVRREIMEEVGLKVKNIRYFSNQPWGYSQSMLVGFFADLDGSDEITLDRNELAEALWISRDELEPRDSLVSLTSTMMESFRLNKFPK